MLQLVIAQDFAHPLIREHQGFMRLSAEQRAAMVVVSKVFPFRINNYVVDRLINWDDPHDPIFRLTFPQREMLSESDFNAVASAMHSGDTGELAQTVYQIRQRLNPHPSGQMTDNVPFAVEDGEPLTGVQHKYQRTVLFFPRQGQTCHSYCNFCFRWPQFIGDPAMRIERSEIGPLLAYLRAHEEVTDLLITGGDPFVMHGSVFARYIDAILAANIPHLRTIRIGTKALTYWPFRFLNDGDAEQIRGALQRIIASGRNLAIMAHLNHPRELAAPAAQEAIAALQNLGAQIRCQTPIIKGLNDDPSILAQLWSEQVRIGCIPYYLFSARDTGAQSYFGVPLARALQVYKEAIRKGSGLAATVRGPVMSAHPGKVQVLDVADVAGQRMFLLQMLQARDPSWSGRTFFAQYNAEALWLDELKPPAGESFFFSPPSPEPSDTGRRSAKMTLMKLQR